MGYPTVAFENARSRRIAAAVAEGDHRESSASPFKPPPRRRARTRDVLSRRCARACEVTSESELSTQGELDERAPHRVRPVPRDEHAPEEIRALVEERHRDVGRHCREGFRAPTPDAREREEPAVAPRVAGLELIGRHVSRAKARVRGVVERPISVEDADSEIEAAKERCRGVRRQDVERRAFEPVRLDPVHRTFEDVRAILIETQDEAAVHLDPVPVKDRDSPGVVVGARASLPLSLATRELSPPFDRRPAAWILPTVGMSSRREVRVRRPGACWKTLGPLVRHLQSRIWTEKSRGPACAVSSGHVFDPSSPLAPAASPALCPLPAIRSHNGSRAPLRVQEGP
jgi:hypothetical protein